MNANKALGAALLVAGVILLILGFNASDSFASEVNETFTGNPSDRSIWFLVGGAALAVFGLIALLARPRTTA
ncbi:MAG TPA: DUF3185 family protein [Planctomycetota bacterium]|nr:DUF3185 family protein [Planctomycetota bacterium]